MRSIGHRIDHYGRLIMATLTIATTSVAPLLSASAVGAMQPDHDGGTNPHLLVSELPGIEVHDTYHAVYSGVDVGAGTLTIDLDMVGEEFDVRVVDAPWRSASCTFTMSHIAGEARMEFDETCDFDHVLDVLGVLFPGEVDPSIYDVYTDGYSAGGTTGDGDTTEGAGDSDTGIDPGYGRRDGDGACLAAKGQCGMAITGAVAAGIGVGAALTPLAGCVVGVAGVSFAILFCAGQISEECGEDFIDMIDLYLDDWLFLFIDIEDFVDVEDFAQTILDATSITHTTVATEDDSLSVTMGYESTLTAVEVGLVSNGLGGILGVDPADIAR